MANQPMHHSSSLPTAIVMMVMDSLETENINTLLTCRAIFPNFPHQINNPLELTPQLGLEIQKRVGNHASVQKSMPNISHSVWSCTWSYGSQMVIVMHGVNALHGYNMLQWWSRSQGPIDYPLIIHLQSSDLGSFCAHDLGSLHTVSVAPHFRMPNIRGVSTILTFR